jgi:hypothetical protein
LSVKQSRPELLSYNSPFYDSSTRNINNDLRRDLHEINDLNTFVSPGGADENKSSIPLAFLPSSSSTTTLFRVFDILYSDYSRQRQIGGGKPGILPEFTSTLEDA